MTGITPLIFVLGTLIGVLVGGALCVRYLRHEIAADICPRLRRLQLQLDNLESAVNLALVTRYAELASQPPRERPYPAPREAPPEVVSHAYRLYGRGGDCRDREAGNQGPAWSATVARAAAVAVGGDYIALGVLCAAEAHGIQVPGDLSIVGFDDTAVFASDCAPHWRPPAFMSWPGYDPLWANLLHWLCRQQ